MNKPLLSLCIPTNGIVEWVLPLLDSIYNQKVDYNLFEVVVTDNGKSGDLENSIEKIKHPNLYYYRTSDIGFTNQISSFKKANGILRKMLNHRAILSDGSINMMIDTVKQNMEKMPILYFGNGMLSIDDTKFCDTIDDFVYAMGVFTSWSAGVAVWERDVEMIGDIVPNKMFPHMCLLFDLRETSAYLINNKVYFEMRDDSRKGGYDFYNTFLVIFLDIISELETQGRISRQSFNKVRFENLDFVCRWYCKLKNQSGNIEHTFIINDLNNSLKKYYKPYHYYWMIIKIQYILRVKNKLKSLIKALDRQ